MYRQSYIRSKKYREMSHKKFQFDVSIFSQFSKTSKIPFNFYQAKNTFARSSSLSLRTFSFKKKKKKKKKKKNKKKKEEEEKITKSLQRNHPAIFS